MCKPGWSYSAALCPPDRYHLRISALENAGAEVLVLRGDVAHPGDMQRMVTEARERFGHIDCVIHAAGILEDGLIQLKNRDSAERVLAPKVRGTLVLEHALERC